MTAELTSVRPALIEHAYTALWRYLVPPSSFGDPATTAVAATGVRVDFADGSRRLCGTSGLWNVNFGYGNRRIADAVHRELLEFSYAGLFRGSSSRAEQAADALARACELGDGGRVLFSTSGSAANDLLMKVARQGTRLRGDRGRNLVVGLRGSYHGQTFGSSALSGDELGQEIYGVDRRLIRHVSPFDGGRELEELCRRDGERIALLVIEPVLGSGALEVPADFLRVVDTLRREHGFWVAADEVATGYHRTGPFLASSTWSFRPNFTVVSKGLTNGTCAASAVLVDRDVFRLWEAANTSLIHGETQAGTPASCAAVIATLEVVSELDAETASHRVADRLQQCLSEWQLGRDDIVLTGRGCFRGIQFTDTSGSRSVPDGAAVLDLVRAIREAGAVVQPGIRGVQLVPSVTYTDSEVDELVSAVDRGAKLFARRRGGASA